MNFPSSNAFCENARNAAMMSNIDDFTDLVFQRGREKYLKKKMDRKIFDRNKDTLSFFYETLGKCDKRIEENPFSVFEEKGKYQEFFEKMVFNRKLLRIFPYFNEYFNKIIMKLSSFHFWGPQLSLSYMSRYYSE